MGGPPINVKYMIYAKFEVEGVVDKPDIIGAIFGQTEGLLGDELDLRELQKMGKVGRIEVEYKSEKGKTFGMIKVPTNLDRAETALIAAALETVDRVGPSTAKVMVDKIEDVREEKRRRIVERAKELLAEWKRKEDREIRRIIDDIMKSLRVEQIIEYGPDKLPAGPDIESSNEVIIVEGRADVINMLKHGHTNVIAMGGASVPQTIIDLTKSKDTVIAFVDGDRGGQLILKKLMQVAKIDYVAFAPKGKEVEELTGKEIVKALNNKMPVERVIEKVLEEPQIKLKPPAPIDVPKEIINAVETLNGTMEGILLNDKWEVVGKFPVSEIYEKLSEMDGVRAVILDGVITQRLVDLCSEKGISLVIGYRIGSIVRRPSNVEIRSFSDILSLKSKAS